MSHALQFQEGGRNRRDPAARRCSRGRRGGRTGQRPGVGISYGTIAEQVFLLRHPSRVRTLTMISGSPLDLPVYQQAPGNSQLALDAVFALCQSQPACRRAFPHLAADWASLWASVGKSPVIIPAAQSPSGTTLRLDQDWFAGKIYDALFTGNIGPLPLIVHTLATARNKTAAMLALTKAYPASPGGISTSAR